MNERVLLVSHTSILGGAERSLVDLAEGLRCGGEFLPAIAAPPGELEATVLDRGIDFYPCRFPRWEGKSGFANRLLQSFDVHRSGMDLRSIGRRSEACIIHANGMKALLPSLVAAKTLKVPVVWHVRDDPRGAGLVRLACALVSRIIAPSEFVAGRLRDLAPSCSRKTLVIPNGVSAPEVEESAIPTLRSNLGIGSGTRLIAMVAQMVPWKRHDLFVEAALKLAPGAPDVHFLVVGGDLWGLHSEYVDSLYRTASHSALQGRVTFAGRRNDVGALMAASDAIVLPSSHEPFGRTIVEAWWLGKPVVVAGEGGPLEMVVDGKTGLHFRPGDADDLAEKIGRLLENPPWGATLGECGKEETKKYDVETHAQRVAMVYRELLQ